MEFKEVLQKLKYCDRFNRSSITKEIIVNIHHVNRSELLIILESIHDTADMAYQAQLIYILTAYLLQNNPNRDVIIKSTFFYETLRMILARGLPLKTTITLNFITSLFYAEDGGSRSRTLTLHAQNLIRSSGCLAAMTHLFMNYMLHHETGQALCRCLAEVCRGSELNQNFCSHLVPVCVQRCLQGNLDVLPVLQSLLFNHKRNTKLFMEIDGAAIFNRKDYLRSEACLQLLNTVIQNAEVEKINTISSRVHENLLGLLKTNSANLNIAQWIKIVLFYLDLKLKESDKGYEVKTTKLKQNTLHMDSNVNETQILFQNIMTEILSYPSKTPLNNLHGISDKLSNLKNISPVVKETETHKNKSYMESKLARTPNSNVSKDKRLSFSFLMDDSLNLELSDHGDGKYINSQRRNINRTVLKHKRYNQSIKSRREYSKRCDSFRTFSSRWDNMTDFKPTFVSTPKRSTQMHSATRNASTKTLSNELNNKSKMINRTSIKKLPKKNTLREKHDTKHKSMSSRIFDAINESCTTVIKSVKSVFTGNKTSAVPINENMKSVKNADEKSQCSFSFIKYMHKREAGLLESDENKDVSSEINTFNTSIKCNTCEDTFVLQQKLATDDQLKSTVKKLKLGINLYGCDFKRISKTMWPRETYMTPSVLYNLYRKLLVK